MYYEKGCVLVVSLCFFCCTTSSGQLSSKALKLGHEVDSNYLEVSSTTEDPFFDFDSDFSPVRNPSSSSSSAIEEDFFSSSFDDEICLTCDDEEGQEQELLPLCDTLSPQQIVDNVACTNDTGKVEEVRYNDVIFEKLLAQIWSDFQRKLNTEAQLYGVHLDPLDVDANLPEPIDLKQKGSLYSADVQMHGIKMYGLSGIHLSDVVVTRNENLTDQRTKVVFAFDRLEINGTYALKGHFGFWEVDSKGEQPFSIKMINATLTYEMHMELVGISDWASLRCDTDTFATENVLITEIKIPLKYDDIDFKFENLGAFANTVANGVGIYFLKTREDMLVGQIKQAIKHNVNSLIC